MEIQALAFDVNGTLINIWTDEGQEDIYRTLRRVLSYQGIAIKRDRLRELYSNIMKEQRAASGECYPEFDAVGIFRRIVVEFGSDFTRAMPTAKQEQLPVFLAEIFRAVSRKRLTLYPFVIDMLDQLRGRYPMAIITDAQSAYARAELHKVGILDYFNPVIVSGDFGYRKPDVRLFQIALDRLSVPAEHVLYVGNDMFRDIYGAHNAGMRTALFDSDQGDKDNYGATPDFTTKDYRELVALLDAQPFPLAT